MSERCPAVSPESGAPCVLGDTPADHYRGHVSSWVDVRGVAWATTKADLRRWAAAVAADPATTR